MLREVEDVWGLPGGNYNRCAELIEDNILYHHPPIHMGKPHFYIMAGICSITSKLSSPGYQEVIFNDTGDLLERVGKEIDYVEGHTFNQGGVPIFCTIMPMSIKTWNMNRLTCRKTKYLLHENEYDIMQTNLENFIQIVNDRIIKKNISNGVSTPLVHRTLTRNRKGRQYTLYKNLTDGCHPNETVILGIIQSLNRAIAQNKNLH